MTQDEYDALDPRAKYQFEKDRRAEKANAMTAAQLKEARKMMEPDPSKTAKSRRKNAE